MYICFIIFYNGIHSVHGLRAIQVRGIQCKSHISCGYVGKTTVNTRLEQIKIIVFGEAFAHASVRQSYSWEVSARMEITSH